MNTEDARKDVDKWRRQNTIHHLSGLAGLASAATAAGGAYKKRPDIVIPALALAMSSGLIQGHAKKERNKALKNLTSFYDLRKREQGLEKQALVGGLLSSGLQALSDIGVQNIPHILHHPYLVSAVDIATLGALAHKMKQSVGAGALRHAKEVAGKTLTKGERFHNRIGDLAEAIVDWGKDKGGIRKYLSSYAAPLALPASTGKTLGNVLKQTERIAPKRTEKAWEMLGKGLEPLQDWAKEEGALIKDKAVRSGLAAGALTGGLAGMGIGHAVGDRSKTKHPLAEKKLPEEITKELMKKAFWNGFSKRAEVMVEGPQVPPYKKNGHTPVGSLDSE